MLITHDTRCALDAVVGLVNTAPGDGHSDGLGDVTALRTFVDAHGVSDVGRLGEADLAAVLRVRERFEAVFAAGDPGTRPG